AAVARPAPVTWTCRVARPSITRGAVARSAGGTWTTTAGARAAAVSRSCLPGPRERTNNADNDPDNEQGNNGETDPADPGRPAALALLRRLAARLLTHDSSATTPLCGPGLAARRDLSTGCFLAQGLGDEGNRIKQRGVALPFLQIVANRV